MSNFTRLLPAVLLAGCAAAAFAQGASATPDDDVRQMLRDYVEAFNAGDAAKVAEFWTEDAVWESGSTGEHTAGRSALLNDFRDVFAASPGIHLTGNAQEIRFVTDDVATLSGTTVLSAPDQAPEEASFLAVLKKQDGKWLLDSVRESAIAPAVSAYDKLRALDFLVGRWRDDTEEARVDTTVRWGVNQTFLVRSFTINREDETVQGTQVIGWDPEQQAIRSWSFHSDGSFGEGSWMQEGPDWVIRLKHVLVDGSRASATQILSRIDDDTLTVTTLARDIAGEPVPATPPVRVIRVQADQGSPTDAASNASAAGGDDLQ